MSTDPHASNDPVLTALRALPVPSADADATGRIHRRARSFYLRQARSSEWPWLRALRRNYFRAEPALTASVVLVYLGWVADTVLTLRR